jgi:integrase
MSRRHNGEGSIYPVKGGYRGYAWCTSPAGERYRKYVKGKTYDETQAAWFKRRAEADAGPVASDVYKLAEFLGYWLEEIVEPNLAPKTYEKYEMFSRLHIVPYLGARRLDKLQVRAIRQWLNKLARICQCCALGKDASRSEAKRRCCAVGECCHEILSAGSRKDARNVLRAALTCAIEEQVISSNPAAVIRLSSRDEQRRRRRRRHSWTVDEARCFLESARRDDDMLYAAYVLVLALVLRRGEVLGLTWDRIDLDTGNCMLMSSSSVPVTSSSAARLRPTSLTRRHRCPSCVSPRLSSVGSSRTRRASMPGRHGSTPARHLPLVMAPRLSRATSTAASTAGSARQAFPRSLCMARGRRAGHCWPR